MDKNMIDAFSKPLSLPCGATLANRIVKAAMSEGMADTANHSTPRLDRLYRRWAGSGAGLLLSGNIQIDRSHLERPLNLVVEDDGGLPELTSLSEAGKSGGAHFWAQLGHTGRRVAAEINPSPLAPSAVGIELAGDAAKRYAPPRAITEAEIENAIARFAFSARRLREAGFTGVQIHAAHGYLVSQFLNPRVNRRTDRWGGSLINRSRFLMEILAAVRRSVGHDFPIAIKLNVSDFQKGGFTNAECVELVRMLNKTSLDLIELSGGSVEQPKAMGVTTQHEGDDVPTGGSDDAYFVQFAGRVRAVAKMPIVVTGGFRTAASMIIALERGDLDAVGLGRPMIVDPDLPKRLLSGEIEGASATEPSTSMSDVLAWSNIQLERMANGLEPDLSLRLRDASSLFAAIESRNLAELLAHRARQAAAPALVV
jgi:2,4-dienoyl-CoA reductase-like NADH-dependent reductase (Old Yellow Enzyme family)